MDRNRNRKTYAPVGRAVSGPARINDEKKSRRNGRKRILVFLSIIAVLILAAFLFYNLFYNRGRNGIGRVTRIGATLSQNLTPFGDKVVFYDGTTLHCVAASGGNEWSYQIGMNADYDATEQRIVAWSGNDLYILNERGRLIYNNKMNGSIQFGSAGKNYAAVLVGNDNNGVVTVINNDGMIVDNIEVENQTLLDIGFFDAAMNSGTQTTEFMWMMGINTSGTVISTEMQTFQPGRLSTGKTSLGEHIAYRVYDENGILNVVTTREIMHFNYRGIESEASTLIYGYTMEDVRKFGNTLYQLLIPAQEQTGSESINNIRLMYGAVDRMIHLPGSCISAKLGERCIYGFSQNAVYACRYGTTNFLSFALPIHVTDVLGMLSNNRAVVASDSEIYIIELPM